MEPVAHDARRNQVEITMTYCEISGLPIADIWPPEFWVVSGGTAYSVHRSKADAIDAICDKWSIKYPTVMFHVVEV